MSNKVYDVLKWIAQIFLPALGTLYFKEHRTESAAMHRPEYLRLTQAERERNERMAREHDS